MIRLKEPDRVVWVTIQTPSGVFYTRAARSAVIFGFDGQGFETTLSFASLTREALNFRTEEVIGNA